MKRILITGASGLVGSHLLSLFGPDDELHLLTRDPAKEMRAANRHYHRVDLSGAFDAGTLPERIDAVIYLAQSEHFRAFPEKARDIFDVNVSGLLRLLDYAHGAGATSFVSASSGGVYGSAERGVSEDLSIPASGSLGFYLSTKLCGEILAENYAPLMHVAVLRLFFAYGSGQKRSMLIPRLIDNVRAGNPVVLQGEDGIRINPVHATDAAAAVKAALGCRGFTRINVAGPEVLSIRALCGIIGEKVGRTPVFAPSNEPPRNLMAEIDKMSSELVAPTRRFADGVSDCI